MVLSSVDGVRQKFSQALSKAVTFVADDTNVNIQFLVVLLFILIFMFTLIKATYISNGIIFGDEMEYKILSKYLHNYQFLVNQNAPTYYVLAPLYFDIYSLSHSFGIDFYMMAKILNSLFFSLAIFPMYGLVRSFTRPRVALLICGVAFLAPYGTYAAYFMPESLYYFLFWVLVYAFLKTVGRNLLLTGIVSGILLGLLYSAKVNALGVAGGVNITLVALGLFHRRLKIKPAHIILSIIILNVCFIVTGFMVRYLVYGTLTPPGMTQTNNLFVLLLGGYDKEINNDPNVIMLSKLILELLNVALGQLLFLSLLFFLPIVVTLYQLMNFIRSKNVAENSVKVFSLCIFSLAVLLSLLAMSIKTSIIDFQQYDEIISRYNNFIFPIFIITYYVCTINTNVFEWFRSNWFGLVSVLGSILLVLAVIFLPAYHTGNVANEPDLDGLLFYPNYVTGSNTAFYFVAILSIVILLYHNRIKPSQRWIVGVFIGATFLISHYYVFLNQISASDNFQRSQDSSTAFNAAIPVGEYNDGLIISSSYQNLFPFVFRFDGVPNHKFIPRGSVIDASDIPSSLPWLITTDHYCINLPLKQSIVLDGGFALDFIDNLALSPVSNLSVPSAQFKFKFTSDCANTDMLKGFYYPESDGTWSQTDNPKIVLENPVQGPIQLELSAIASGPNADRPLEIQMGDQKQSIIIKDKLTILTIPFDLAAPTDTLSINGIKPTSPLSLGVGSDSRMLGIKIYSLVIRLTN